MRIAGIRAMQTVPEMQNPPNSQTCIEGGLRCQGVYKTTHQEKPLVTIITVVFNGSRHLAGAMDSVFSQDYTNVEYIIIDGGSSDGTLDLIREHQARIDYWRSEPDEGIYDAMNKGIELARGDVIGLLNADDILYPAAISRIIEAMGGEAKEKYTCGAVDLIDETGAVYGHSRPFEKTIRERRRYLEMPCPHLSVFVGREVYERIGAFDTQFRLRADYDFLLRAIESNAPCTDLDFAVGAFRSGGSSGGMATWLETRRVLQTKGINSFYTNYIFIRSVTRSWLAGALPPTITSIIKRFTISKNNYFME
ncbi:glycosyltransferase family 2 protein [Ectothiorhodospira marina]|uniref:glycosyltransferase family 2 protein n=1 Tax=Ectothiorhodospira marina TaxID=1396821 RepID=UPI001C434D63|nr:glycosyltransferase family 2 protein [Ectothiorhodospira marina]